jgi:hypothetical protein
VADAVARPGSAARAAEVVLAIAAGEQSVTSADEPRRAA